MPRLPLRRLTRTVDMIYIHTYVYIYIYIFIYIHAYVYRHCVCIYMYTFMTDNIIGGMFEAYDTTIAAT